MIAILVLAALAAIAWFWLDSLRAKEMATRLSLYACRRADVQLLDDTVCLQHIKPARDANGRVRLRRTYHFDFSVEGLRREKGRITLLGLDVQHLDLAVTHAHDGDRMGR